MVVTTAEQEDEKVELVLKNQIAEKVFANKKLNLDLPIL